MERYSRNEAILRDKSRKVRKDTASARHRSALKSCPTWKIYVQPMRLLPSKPLGAGTFIRAHEPTRTARAQLYTIGPPLLVDQPSLDRLSQRIIECPTSLEKSGPIATHFSYDSPEAFPHNLQDKTSRNAQILPVIGIRVLILGTVHATAEFDRPAENPSRCHLRLPDHMFDNSLLAMPRVESRFAQASGQLGFRTHRIPIASRPYSRKANTSNLQLRTSRC